MTVECVQSLLFFLPESKSLDCQNSMNSSLTSIQIKRFWNVTFTCIFYLALFFYSVSTHKYGTSNIMVFGICPLWLSPWFDDFHSVASFSMNTNPFTSCRPLFNPCKFNSIQRSHKLLGYYFLLQMFRQFFCLSEDVFR